MFERITPGFATVQERLYDETKILQTSGPFEGFEISDFGGNMITILWKTQDNFPSKNSWENVTTPVHQPQPTICPPAPKKQPNTTSQPVYRNLFPYPYAGPSADPYTGIFGNFLQNDGDYTEHSSLGGNLDGNVEYINQLRYFP
jgi:hypothetical protein